MRGPLLPNEALDEGLDLVVSEEVGGELNVSDLLSVEDLEVVHDQAHLDALVADELLGGVDLAELELPLGDRDYAALQVGDVYAVVLVS